MSEALWTGLVKILYADTYLLRLGVDFGDTGMDSRPDWTLAETLVGALTSDMPGL